MKRDQKTKHVTYVATLLAVTIAITWSCQKATPFTPAADLQTQQDEVILVPEHTLQLDYKDSVLFYKSNPKIYIVRPQRTPTVPGYFVSSLEGLVINASTGAINVNNSESGLRYRIYYLSIDNEPVDSADVTIAGIDYEDGIFEINASPEHEKAVPVYKGSSNALPCIGDNGGTIECVFDETDLDGNGTSDILGANAGKLRVNKNTGSIDLEQSLLDGVFGSNPVNGRTKDFTIQYRLNDDSRKALNKIKVRVYHFTSRDKIPAWLIEELRSRKECAPANKDLLTNGNFIQSNLLSISKPKRPPLIIIVSGYASL